MASFFLSDFIAKRDVADYSAAPVGARRATQQITAIRVIEKDNELYFDEEIPLFHCPRLYYEVAGKKLKVPRMEFKIELDNSAIATGDELVMVERPYSRSTYQTASFKGPCEDDIIKKYNLTEAAQKMEDLEFCFHLEDTVDVDYCEHGNYLTAAFIGALPLTDRGVQVNGFQEVAYVIGVCKNFKKYCEMLANHERVEKLLQWTEKSQINVDYPKASAPKSSVTKLNEEVIEARQGLIFQAVCQALAGPHNNSKDWHGKPVIDLVERIYRDHLSEHNKLKVPTTESPDESNPDLLDLSLHNRYGMLVATSDDMLDQKRLYEAMESFYRNRTGIMREFVRLHIREEKNISDIAQRFVMSKGKVNRIKANLQTDLRIYLKKMGFLN